MPQLDCCKDEFGVPYEVPSKLGMSVTAVNPACIEVFNFGMPLSWTSGDWSTPSPLTFGATVSCVGPLGDDHADFQLDLRISDCDESVSDGQNSSCGTIILPFGVFIKAACCGLGAGGTEFLQVDVADGPIMSWGAPPKVPGPCDNVPPDEKDCCEAEFANGGGGGGGNGCGGGFCRQFSSKPVRYATGELVYQATDIKTNGFGLPWGHTRSFASRLSYSETLGNGFNWQVEEWPYLATDRDGNITVLGTTNSAIWFEKVGNAYVAEFGSKMILERDLGDQLFRLYDLDGSITEFNSFTGTFRTRIAPSGEKIEVTAMASNGYNFTEVERSYTEGESTVTEQFLYNYSSPMGDALLQNVTLRRQVDGGTWTNVSRAVYTYYGYDAEYGGWEDLETATTQSWDGNQWQDTGTSYYRYYTFPAGSSSSSSSNGSGGTPNTLRRLKYAINPDSFDRLAADPGVANPLTATDAQVALYADFYFEYDDDRRVTKEMVQGGTRTFLFAYAESAFGDDYNAWKTKTTETLPDGSQDIVYANYAGRTMLAIHKDGDDEWYEFWKYDNNGNAILNAASSAITGYDDQYSDLLHEVDGNYEFMKDNDGLIRTYEYNAATNWLAASKIQEGEFGTPIKLEEREYVSCPLYPVSSSSSSSNSSSSGSSSTPVAEPAAYFLSKKTVYPSDTNQDQKIITTYDYTWYPGTCQVQQKTTTLPVISTDQNGSGVANTRKAYFDEYGNLTWQMDERGFITRTKYDIPTGAVTQRIADVDTSIETDAPTGWVTPSGGGLNLVTDFEHDDRGRITQSLAPSHSIDLNGAATTIRTATWTVYDDDEDADVIRTANGYATGASPDYTYTLVNPVSITKADKNGNTREMIQATRASADGKLLPSDTFAQSTYVRWTTNQYSECCLLASRRVYHTIPTSGEGTSGTNYDQTDFGYDVMKRRNRAVTPGGTVTFSVYDTRGFTTATYVGTDDTGATDQDPTGGGAMGNNMVIITANQYDNGNAGGDGNLTQQTNYVDSSNTRVTEIEFDWRNRRTVVDGEIDYYQKTYFDNLSRVIKVERYDTTSGGNLIGRAETFFDDLSRVYRTKRYAVDPSTGTVGNSLTNNTWFDANGNVMKSLPPGSKLFRKTEYDGLNRPTTTYVGFDTDETTYAEAQAVTGDTILQQAETTYDNASNVIDVAQRKRYHNATGTGALNGPGGPQPKARVTYAVNWTDGVNRTVATANYGTNGGSALSRPSTIPERSDDVLVTTTAFDSSGNVEFTTDPLGMVTCFEYDDAGRRTKVIENCQTSSSSSSSSSHNSTGCEQSADKNRTTETTYNADGNTATLVAWNASTGNQTTTYTYGTTLTDSEVAASTLLHSVAYPDSSSGSDVVAYMYNRQGQPTTRTDQNGTVRSFDFDDLGRLAHDRVTTLGSGVDGAVRRISYTYEVRGLIEDITSYDDTTVGQGSIVNEVESVYNDFAQLNTSYQSHSGAVNTMSTPRVEYAYADGSDNMVRPTSLTYPDGRVINYDYGSAGSLEDNASRVKYVKDGNDDLMGYSDLGVYDPVIVDYLEPNVRYTLVGTAGGDDPDTGDIYRGLDRFGRVKDSYWYDYGATTDAARIKYGYNRASSRTWRENAVDTTGKYDEYYIYDGLQRLVTTDRGELNAQHTGIDTLDFAQCWTLDETGNWQQFREDDDGSGTWDLAQARTGNTVNEITNITETAGPSWATPGYDAAGNMTTVPQPADLTETFAATYDAWNRLIKLEDDSTSDTVQENGYDGRRYRVIAKSYTGGSLDETRHVYFTATWQAIEERVDSATNAERQFVWGLRYIDDLVLRDRDTTGNGTLDERLYAMQDGNWNVTAICNENGNVRERYAYASYGTPIFLSPAFAVRGTSDVGWETTYGGYRWLPQVRLFSVRMRHFHPVIGVWLARDPLAYGGGSVNLLEYVNARPLTAVDPRGLQWGVIDPLTGDPVTGFEPDPDSLPPTVITELDDILDNLGITVHHDPDQLGGRYQGRPGRKYNDAIILGTHMDPAEEYSIFIHEAVGGIFVELGVGGDTSLYGIDGETPLGEPHTRPINPRGPANVSLIMEFAALAEKSPNGCTCDAVTSRYNDAAAIPSDDGVGVFLGQRQLAALVEFICSCEDGEKDGEVFRYRFRRRVGFFGRRSYSLSAEVSCNNGNVSRGRTGFSLSR